MKEKWPDIALIANKRKELRVTQEELSRRSGVPQSAISRIESGQVYTPSYDMIRKLFEALDALEAQDGPNAEVASRIDKREARAADLMNTNIFSVTPDSKITDAWAIMRKEGLSQLPVIDERSRIVGGISENSIPSTGSLLTMKVEKIMSDPFPIVGKNTKLPTLVSLLRTEPAILVVERGRAVGIITTYDIIESIYKKESAF